MNARADATAFEEAPTHPRPGVTVCQPSPLSQPGWTGAERTACLPALPAPAPGHEPTAFLDQSAMLGPAPVPAPEPAATATTATTATRTAPPMARPATVASAVPCLRVLSGPDAGRRFALSDRCLIGRDPSCQARLTDPCASRIHAEIVRTPAGYELVDRRSRAGTHVAGRRTVRRRISARDRIEIADTVLQIEPAPLRRLGIMLAAAVVLSGTVTTVAAMTIAHFV